MSIDASKWARTADVQKSSSKLVLLELAHLVRAYATDWTVFASIEHLARVTHLNRKTVIEALARLRELGAIVDTGLRAGASRSCLVYRLCPTAVPTVCTPAADTAAGDGAPYRRPGQADLLDEGCDPTDDQAALENPADFATPSHAADGTVPGAAESAVAESASAPSTPAQAELAIEAPPVDTPSAPHEVPGPAQTAPPAAPTSPSPRTRRGKGTKKVSPPAAGAAATRLPADWVLPTPWRAWTHRERPHWGPDRVDAMVLTFCAYWRSKPGHEGFSEDWFASWRLWVFRERETRAGGAAWHSTWSGIVAKGRDLGLEQAPGEQEQAFRMRVHRAAGVPLSA